MAETRSGARSPRGARLVLLVAVLVLGAVFWAVGLRIGFAIGGILDLPVEKHGFT